MNSVAGGRDSVNLITEDNGESRAHLLPTCWLCLQEQSPASVWTIAPTFTIFSLCVCVTESLKRSLFSRLMKEVDRLFSFWTPESQEAGHYDTNCRYIATQWTNQSSLSLLMCGGRVVRRDFNKHH